MYDVTIKKRISCVSKEDSRLVCRVCRIALCLLYLSQFDTQISTLSTALEE